MSKAYADLKDQKRQPIYKCAVGRWRVYEDYLGPLLITIGVTTSAET